MREREDHPAYYTVPFCLFLMAHFGQMCHQKIPLLIPVSVHLSLLALWGKKTIFSPCLERQKPEAVCSKFPPVCLSHMHGTDCGTGSHPCASSAITAASKQLMRFVLRVLAAPGLDQNFPQDCQGFQTAVAHSHNGRKPVFVLNAVWRQLLVLLFNYSLLWSVLHPHPYLNGTQRKLNASQTNAFHPSLSMFTLSSLVVLVRSM